MKNGSLLIHSGYVVTLNKNRDTYENGAVYIENDLIKNVGKTDELKEKYSADKEIDASGFLVLPGFIDAHNHVVQYLSKGIGDDVHGENEEAISRWGVRSLERYRNLGLFDPNLLLIHMGWVNEREIQWLKAHDVKVVHCPSASLHGAYGVISHGMFPEMIRAGVTVALGNDSATAGRFLDMVKTMYLAACAHKDVTGNPKEIGAHKALEMATVDGARALLWDDAIGSLEKGKKADVIMIDTSGQEWHPIRDPITHLIYSADGKSVDTVIIDGRLIMEHRNILTASEEETVENVDRLSFEVMKRAGIEVKSPWTVIS